MGQPGFNLMITGKLVEGVRMERAVAGLTRLLSVDEKKAETLLDGKERIIKRNVSMDALPRYQAALRKIGVESRFRPILALQDDETETQSIPAPKPQPTQQAVSQQRPTQADTHSAPSTDKLSVAETGATLPVPAKPKPIDVNAEFVLFEPGANLDPIPRDLTPPPLRLDHLHVVNEDES